MSVIKDELARNLGLNARRIAIASLIIGVLAVSFTIIVMGSGGSSYSLNSVILNQFGPSITLENMIHGQSYCAGASTAGLVLRKVNPNLFVSGVYGPRDMNVTGAYLQISLQVSSTAIANTFTQGSCGTLLFSLGVSTAYYAVTNQIGYMSGASGRSVTAAAGSTVYLGINVQIVGSADVQIKTPIATSAGYSLFMQEQV